MSLQAGFVGFPNVGKSTLFNALLSEHVADNSNYPFCTIEPNVGVVEVPDNRLEKLAEIEKSARAIPATVEFVDIAGLVEGAHQGQGLGNKFLSNIREVELIIMILRDFTDPNVARAGSRDPLSDFRILTTELQLADLQQLEKQKEPKGANRTKENLARWQVISRIRLALEDGVSARQVDLTPEETKLIKSFSLLTLKPMIIVLNTDENKLNTPADLIENIPTLRLCAQMEAELSGLNLSEKKELLQTYGVESSGLEKLIQQAYELLGYQTFFTAGPKEARAWQVKKNTPAPEASGVIHTDFEKGFIKAKIASYDHFLEYNGWTGCKNHGKIRLEGKTYLMQEGDVVEFMIKS